MAESPEVSLCRSDQESNQLDVPNLDSNVLPTISHYFESSYDSLVQLLNSKNKNSQQLQIRQHIADFITVVDVSIDVAKEGAEIYTNIDSLLELILKQDRDATEQGIDECVTNIQNLAKSGKDKAQSVKTKLSDLRTKLFNLQADIHRTMNLDETQSNDILTEMKTAYESVDGLVNNITPLINWWNEVYGRVNGIKKNVKLLSSEKPLWTKMTKTQCADIRNKFIGYENETEAKVGQYRAALLTYPENTDAINGGHAMPPQHVFVPEPFPTTPVRKLDPPVMPVDETPPTVLEVIPNSSSPTASAGPQGSRESSNQKRDSNIAVGGNDTQKPEPVEEVSAVAAKVSTSSLVGNQGLRQGSKEEEIDSGVVGCWTAFWRALFGK